MQTVTLGASRREVTGAGAVRTVAGAPFGSDKANEDVAPVCRPRWSKPWA